MAMSAPMIEPTVVVVSSSIPNLTLTKPCCTYLEAEPVDDAMTPMSETPTASCMLKPSARVSAGITMMPPPSPSRERERNDYQGGQGVHLLRLQMGVI